MARSQTVTTTTTRDRYDLRNPARAWHMVLGWTLLAIAILGLVPAAVDALHDLRFHIEGGENALHWVLAIGTLGIAYFVRNAKMQSAFAFMFATAYIGVGILGFIQPDIGFWHVGLGDNILHLALGGITLAAGLATKRGDTQGQGRRYAAA